MGNKPIGKHLKKIVDDLVDKYGIEVCLSRSFKLNNMNKHLLEYHESVGNTNSAFGVQKNIETNNKATEYLKELLNKTNE